MAASRLAYHARRYAPGVAAAALSTGLLLRSSDGKRRTRCEDEIQAPHQIPETHSIPKLQPRPQLLTEDASSILEQQAAPQVRDENSWLAAHEAFEKLRSFGLKIPADHVRPGHNVEVESC